MKFKLLEKRKEAENTYSFDLEPTPNFKFLAGQYIYLTLPELKYPDTKGATRHFTISSSPTQKDKITVTTKIRETSGYKKTLFELPEGSEIEVEGPNGVFVYDEDIKYPVCMLAGGIGITPFMSIIKYATDMGITNPIGLIYSNKTEEEITFQKELTALSKSHDNFKLYETLTSEDIKPSWKGLKGRISADMIKSIYPTINPEMEFWVCGPNTFVDAMELILQDAGVAVSKIITEKFTGY